MRMPRLEFQAPPDVFYNESDACKYTTSSRIIGIQDFEEEAAAARPPQQCVPKLLLDIGYTPAKNDFLFETRLQSFIYDVLMQHSRGKCALVFCTTRKVISNCRLALYMEVIWNLFPWGPIIPSLTLQPLFLLIVMCMQSLDKMIASFETELSPNFFFAFHFFAAVC
ncbi:hypothetical protein PVAP13_6NG212500 [Panicum virgatum]|uniref:Uncharacterized protein n=1 Tax=Panicum virgatum TaxID=38727 RepID=A0A8T0QZJ7_PANVG|nr:hypothetical protein PVAP13_6NG212500 [Panicum virgatum]